MKKIGWGEEGRREGGGIVYIRGQDRFRRLRCCRF